MNATGFVDIIRNNEIVLSVNYRPAYVRLPDFLQGRVIRAMFDGKDLSIRTVEYGDLVCRVNLTYFAYDQAYHTIISNWYYNRETLYDNLRMNHLELLNPPIKDKDSYFRLRYDHTLGQGLSKTRVTVLFSYEGYLADVKIFINDMEVMNSYGTKALNYLKDKFPEISWDTLNYMGKVVLGGDDRLV